MIVAGQLPTGQNETVVDGADQFSEFGRWIDFGQKHIALSILSWFLCHFLALSNFSPTGFKQLDRGDRYIAG